MQIKGIEGLSDDLIRDELQSGAKFVVYQYCISLLVLTFKRRSKIHFIKANESSIKYGWMYILISLILGWWGIPWGPIYTISAVVKNCMGGVDITDEVISSSNF